jgi:hypothetical protein
MARSERRWHFERAITSLIVPPEEIFPETKHVIDSITVRAYVFAPAA